MSWLSCSVSEWSLGQHVCRFSLAITHLSSFWGFGNLQNHPVSLKIYASLLIANSKSVLNIKSRRRPTSLYLKRRPYKVILGGIRAKHSASSLKVFICNFCLSSNASLSWPGTSFFPRVRHLWIWCIEFLSLRAQTPFPRNVPSYGERGQPALFAGYISVP